MLSTAPAARISRAEVCERRRRRRSSSTTVERSKDTCGRGDSGPCSCRGGRSVCSRAGFGLSSSRSVIRFMVLAPTCDSEHDSLAVSQMVNGSEQKRNPDQPPRILALDFGSKTIGLAVTDELGFTAQGLPTLRRSNKRNDLDHLRRTIRQYGVSEIVMGLPLRMSGSEGIQSEKVQAFAEELRRKFKLPVHLFDERLTSVEANRVLRETEMSIQRRAEVVDQLAAVLILQSFLEFRKARNPLASDQHR